MEWLFLKRGCNHCWMFLGSPSRTPVFLRQGIAIIGRDPGIPTFRACFWADISSHGHSIFYCSNGLWAEHGMWFGLGKMREKVMGLLPESLILFQRKHPASGFAVYGSNSNWCSCSHFVAMRQCSWESCWGCQRRWNEPGTENVSRLLNCLTLETASSWHLCSEGWQISSLYHHFGLAFKLFVARLILTLVF